MFPPIYFLLTDSEVLYGVCVGGRAAMNVLVFVSSG